MVMKTLTTSRCRRCESGVPEELPLSRRTASHVLPKPGNSCPERVRLCCISTTVLIGLKYMLVCVCVFTTICRNNVSHIVTQMRVGLVPCAGLHLCVVIAVVEKMWMKMTEPFGAGNKTRIRRP